MTSPEYNDLRVELIDLQIRTTHLEERVEHLECEIAQVGDKTRDEIVNGILNALPFLNSVIEKIKGLIPDWAKSALGVSTEDPVAAGRPGVAGTTLAQPVSTQLTPTAKIAAKPQASGTQNPPLAAAALPGKPGGKPYALPSRAQSSVQVHFSPQVTVQGSGANAAGDINNVLSLSQRELERMINDVMAQQQRRGYA